MNFDVQSTDGRATLTIDSPPLIIAGEEYQGCQRCDKCRRIYPVTQMRFDEDTELLLCRPCCR